MITEETARDFGISGAPMRAMTSAEMGAAEGDAAWQCKVFFDAYLAFPTAENFDLLLNQMQQYQTAWMNGRSR